MADINVERKRGGGFLPWLLGLLALAALALLLLRGCGDDGDEVAPVVTDTVVTDTTAMAPVAPPAPVDSLGAAGAAGAALPIAAVLGGVDQYAGQEVSGTATVPETPSDRGFWVETNGQRMFVILAEPTEALRDVDPGQTVRLTGARVMRGSEASQIPGDVEAETRTLAQGQQAFLVVPSRGVEIVAGGNTTPN